MLDLEKRDINADQKSVTSRIEAFKDREPSANPVLIIDPVKEEEYPAEQSYIPEISAEELDLEILKTSIIKHGALIVRGLIPSSDISPLKNIVDGVVDACSKRQPKKKREPGPYLNPPEKFHTYMPGEDQVFDLGSTRQFLNRSGAAMCVESPPAH